MVLRRQGTSVWKGQPQGRFLQGPELSGELRGVEGHLRPILSTGSDWNNDFAHLRSSQALALQGRWGGLGRERRWAPRRGLEGPLHTCSSVACVWVVIHSECCGKLFMTRATIAL